MYYRPTRSPANPITVAFAQLAQTGTLFLLLTPVVRKFKTLIPRISSSGLTTAGASIKPLSNKACHHQRLELQASVLAAGIVDTHVSAEGLPIALQAIRDGTHIRHTQAFAEFQTIHLHHAFGVGARAGFCFVFDELFAGIRLSGLIRQSDLAGCGLFGFCCSNKANSEIVIGGTATGVKAL